MRILPLTWSLALAALASAVPSRSRRSAAGGAGPRLGRGARTATASYLLDDPGRGLGRDVRPHYLLACDGVGLRLEELGFVVVEVLARVRRLVFRVLHQLVEGCGEEAAEDGAEPVDPVVAGEGAGDAGGAEAAGGIQ